MDFFKKAGKLSKRELKTVASYCAAAAFLLAAAIFLSATATTPFNSVLGAVSPGSSLATPFGVTQGVPEYNAPTPYVGGYPSPLNCGYGSTDCYPYTTVAALSIYPQGVIQGLTRKVDLNNASTTVGSTPTLFAPGPVNIEWSCLPSQYANRTCPYTYQCGTNWWWCGWGECSGPAYCTAYPDCSINSTFANTSVGVNFNTGGALIGTTTVNFPVGKTSYTYAVQCKNTNTNQSWIASTTVQITSATLSLTANPQQVVTGGTSILSWATSGTAANSCLIVDSKGTIGAKGLGSDTGGNGNAWVLNNLSTYDQTGDSPTNNFAKLSPGFYSSGYGAGALYGGGTVAYGSYGAVGDFQLNAGQWYWEYNVGSIYGGYPIVGVFADATSGFGNRAYPGHGVQEGGFGYTPDGRVTSAGNYVAWLSAFTNDDTIGVAYDADSGKVYFSRNGVWQNNDNLIPFMTAASTNGVTMSVSTLYSAAYDGWKAGDKDSTTGWDQYPTPPSVASPQWLRVDFGAGNAKTVRQYSIKNWSTPNLYDPLDFTLEGSNDATTCSAGNGVAGGVWTAGLDTETSAPWVGGTGTFGYQALYFTVANPGSYRCYRLKVTRSNGNSQMLISELGLYPEVASPTDGTSYVGIIKNGWPGLASYYSKTYVNFGQGGSPGTIFTDSSGYGRKIQKSIGSSPWYSVYNYPQVSSTKSKFAPSSAQFASGVLKVIPKSSDITPAGDYTIDLWVYPTALPGGVGIFSRDSSNGYSPYMIYQNGSRISFYASNTGSAWDIASDEVICPTVAVNNWYHLAVVHSGTNFSLYCNGTRNDTFNRPR